MGIGQDCLVLGVIAGISFLGFGTVNNAYATDYEIIDEDSCLDLPGGPVETWDDPTSTCTKPSTLIITAADTLIVPDGITLAFSNNINLINDGDITNKGLITIEGSNGNAGVLVNQNDAVFTNSGTLTIIGINDITGQIRNQNDAVFTNSGTLTITGTNDESGLIRNQNDAVFTNSGTITIMGTRHDSGRISNLDDADFTNSGTITITGFTGSSGQLRNEDDAGFTNSGIITIKGTNFDSGQLRNDNNAVFINSKTITIDGINHNTGGIFNQNNALIFNNCGQITFVSITGNQIEEEHKCFNSISHEDPTIGKTRGGFQVVENGICINIRCWTVTENYYQDFKLVEMLSDSTHTITTTVYCHHGVAKCNYVAFGVSPYGTNIADSIWKIILQKDHLDNWTMKVIDDDGYLGEVISTTQKIKDGRYLSVSITIEFKKPTPGMILNVEVRDSKGGYRDFKFNDGISIVDAYAYPIVHTSYEPPLEVKPLCLNENSNKRYTCAFDKIRDWTIKNAEALLEKIDK